MNEPDKQKFTEATKAAELSKLLDQIGVEAPGLMSHTAAAMAADFQARGITDPARISAALAHHAKVNPHTYLTSQGGSSTANPNPPPASKPLTEREFPNTWSEAIHTNGEVQSKRRVVTITPGGGDLPKTGRARLEEFYSNQGAKNSTTK